jgi:hypothetical protein
MDEVYTNKPGRLLSKSSLGTIRKCECCNIYHLSIGNVTVRLCHTDAIILAGMLVEAINEDSRGEHFVAKN